MNNTEKIGFGGGCHWCTEAVFQSLKGVERVEQGFIASVGNNDSFSEAVIVRFDLTSISLKELIEIHLYTHNSTSDHSMRPKYRSAVYTFSEKQRWKAKGFLTELQSKLVCPPITEVLSFDAFKPSRAQFKDYYYKNPQKPFCRNYIEPKLKSLLEQFSGAVDSEKMTSSQPIRM